MVFTIVGFIAVGVVVNALSQIVYYYSNFLFKKDIVESEELKNEAVLNQGEELMQQTILDS